MVDICHGATNGTHYNTNDSGVGFKDYLNYLDRNDLVNLINNQLDEARANIVGIYIPNAATKNDTGIPKAVGVS